MVVERGIPGGDFGILTGMSVAISSTATLLRKNG